MNKMSATGRIFGDLRNRSVSMRIGQLIEIFAISLPSGWRGLAAVFDLSRENFYLGINRECWSEGKASEGGLEGGLGGGGCLLGGDLSGRNSNSNRENGSTTVLDGTREFKNGYKMSGDKTNGGKKDGGNGLVEVKCGKDLIYSLHHENVDVKCSQKIEWLMNLEMDVV